MATAGCMKMVSCREGVFHVAEQYLNPPGVCQPGRPRWPAAVCGLLDALLPPRCVLCGDPADTADGDGALCRPCLAGLPGNPGACPRCGLPESGEGCRDCRIIPPPWRHVQAPIRYDFPIDRLVRRLKFGRDLAAGRALAAAMAWAGPPPVRGSAVLVPVPLHGFRRWRRGYNQAAEIALHLSKATGWPVDAGSLKRVRHTRAQSGLHARQRKTNLDGAFAWRAGRPIPDTVVLVDDVMTTGATLDACTRVARRAGARTVVLWVAARALGGATPGTTVNPDVIQPNQSASNAQRS